MFNIWESPFWDILKSNGRVSQVQFSPFLITSFLSPRAENFMTNRLKGLRTNIVERVLPWIVLAILLLYTYARIFEHPYMGFRWDDHNNIIYVFAQGNSTTPLQVGDHLIQLGSTSLADFQADYRKTLFYGVKAGQVVPIIIERTDQRLTIPWKFPGLNQAEFFDQATSEVWLAYIFWLAGTLTLLHLRPKSGHWGLMIAFNYLTAVWIAVGGGASFYHLWYSAFLLRICIWFCLPLYIHFHWVFPRSLGELPAWLMWGGYLLASVLAISECFQLLRGSSYLLGFLLALGGSFLLLLGHLILQPDVRRDLRFLMFALALSLIVSIITGVVLSVAILPGVAVLGLVGLPFIPMAYFYAAYRRQLGNLELRINRFISVLLFLVLVSLVVLPWILLANLWITVLGAGTTIGVAGSLLTALMAVLGFPYFESFVEHRLLGIPYPPKNLQEIYSIRITTSTSLSQLVQLLGDEIIPSLLVRQFVFLRLESGAPKVLLATNVPSRGIPQGDNVSDLLSLTGEYRPIAVSGVDAPYPWARLVLSLKVGHDVIGLWMFGRRDPDDIYSQEDITVIRSLANQTAVALSNILQTDRLRNEYEANINRHEEERLRLALDLHDSVLNQMAAMLMNLDEAAMTPGFQEAYNKLTQRLREIVSDLRPPMLNFGLMPALKELAENLVERSKDTVSVEVNLQAGETRYPTHIEHHIFRIVQEACENALKHAKAGKISISGQLDVEEIDLRVDDNGVGFDTDGGLELDTLLANKHFGLVGIVERAKLIGAEVKITTAPLNGTHIRTIWHPAAH